MKILIAGALDLHENQDEKAFCEAASRYYKERGHTTDICYLPFKMDYHGIHEQILAYRLLTTYPEADMLITVGYPAFALKHPNKHVFLLEFLPEFHSNYNTEYGFMEQWYRTQKDQVKWQNLLRTERTCLKEAKTIHCSSIFLKKELENIGCQSEAFDSFAGLSESKKDTPLGVFIIQSCLTPMDRIDLLLESVKQTDNELRIYVPSAEDCYISAVETRINRLQLTGRVQIIRSEIGTDDLEKCKGVICLRRYSGHIPSYVSVAAKSEIQCIVLSDGGALCETPVSKNVTITEPDPEKITSVMKRTGIRNGRRNVIKQSLADETKRTLGKLVE